VLPIVTCIALNKYISVIVITIAVNAKFDKNPFLRSVDANVARREGSKHS
jgi:hypothetical protein